MNKTVQLANWLEISGSRIFIPAALVGLGGVALGAGFGAFLALERETLVTVLVLAFIAAFLIAFSYLVWHERVHGGPMRNAETRAWINAGATSAERKRRSAVWQAAGQLGVDMERDSPSALAHANAHFEGDTVLPSMAFNTDGSLMLNSLIDVHGKAYGASSSDE